MEKVYKKKDLDLVRQIFINAHNIWMEESYSQPDEFHWETYLNNAGFKINYLAPRCKYEKYVFVCKPGWGHGPKAWKSGMKKAISYLESHDLKAGVDYWFSDGWMKDLI